MKHQVFLSYMREDARAVQELRAHLAAIGVDAWMDEDALAGGEVWARSIENEIRQSSHFMPCFSEHFESRPNSYMKQEITIAARESANRLDGAFYIIPVLLSGGRIPDLRLNSTLMLSDLNVISCAQDMQEAIKKIESSIQLAHTPRITRSIPITLSIAMPPTPIASAAARRARTNAADETGCDGCLTF